METRGVVVYILFLIVLIGGAGCREKETEALGTLEWDINRGKAPASEVIEIFVRERERGNMELLIAAPVRNLELLIGKIEPYVVLSG